MSAQFLPVNRQDMAERGWDQVDFVYVSGDAYVDHPSFGAAIVTRLLESHGYKVGVIAQPDWNDPASVAALGEPRLAFLVSAGNMDSMVNHYTVARKRRREDAYSPGGQAGLRPNHAAVVYSNLIRRTFKKTPIVLGGIEASLRRLAHYDYWSDKMKRSILLDSGADLVSFGMGERSVVEIADALAAGLSIDDLTFIDGTVYRASSLEHVYDAVELPSFPDLQADPLSYARSFAVQYANSDPFIGKRLVEPYSDHEFVVQNPPAAPLSQAEMDAVYRLPFARTYHPDVRGGRRRAGHQGGAVQPHQQPRLLRRVLVLRAHVPSGAHRAGAQPRLARGGGAGHHRRARLQGLYPRRGRPHGELPRPRLRQADEGRRLPAPALPVPGAVRAPRGGPCATTWSCCAAAQAARREEGVRAQRHPLRLRAGRPRHGDEFLDEICDAPRERPAARGARARVRHRARP